MTDEEAKNMIGQYAVSWYGDVDRIPLERVASGRGIDRARGGPLVLAMQENVEQAKKNRDGIKARYEEAQLDGLFDVDALDAAGKKVRGEWIEAIDVQRGDRARCMAELTHWREYLAWAMAQENVLPRIEPDSRLPPERDAGDDGGEYAPAP